MFEVSCGQGYLAAVGRILVGELGEEAAQVVFGILPLKGFRVAFVAVLELNYALAKGVEIRKIIGRKELSLEHGEVQFDLIQPAGVDGGVYEDGVGIPL